MRVLKILSIFLILFLNFPEVIFSQNVDHIVLSEIAFGNSDSKDEFVEIYNPTDQDINIKELGLKLHIRNSSGSKDSNKTLEWKNEIIKSRGYFLFTSKDSTTYLDSADAIYSADLVSNGAVYISTSKTKMTDIIDFIAWGTHSIPNEYETQITDTFSSGKSIERKSNSSGTEENAGNNWDTNSNDFLIRENPDPQNSSNVIQEIREPTSDSAIEADKSSENLDDDNSTESNEIVENSTKETEQNNEEALEIIEESIIETDTQTTEEENENIIDNEETLIDDNTQTEDEIVIEEVPKTETEEELIEDPITENLNESLEAEEKIEFGVWISEVFPKPRDTEPEWIELYNSNETKFLSQGSILCVRDMCITLNENILAKSYYVLSELDTEKFIGEWPNLINTSADITWKKDEKIIESFSYESAKIGQSFIKDESTNIVKITTHITQGKENTFNQSPFALIQVQGDGQTFGTVPFSLNVTGEESSDPDNDELQFLWDFGNGQTSDKENPLGISYQNPGRFLVKLKITDPFGAISETEKEVLVLDPPRTITKYISTSSPSKTPSLQEKKNFSLARNTQNKKIYISKVSVNDSVYDYIEIQCKNCGSDIPLEGYKLYDDKVFYTFSSQDILKKNEVWKASLVKESDISLAKERMIVKSRGLTKTDEQLIILNKENEIIDTLCWNNFDETLTQSEKKEEENLRSLGAWKGKCIDSKGLVKKDSLLVRDMNKSNTNTKNDWGIFLDNKAFACHPREGGDPYCKERDDIDNNTSKLKESSNLNKVDSRLRGNDSNMDSQLTTQGKLAYEGLIISEFVPNPKGNDTAFEWIELKNISEKDINMQDWTIEGRSKKYTFKNQILEAGEFFILERSVSKIAIPNKNSWLILKNPKEKIMQNISYNEVFESASYAINEKEDFQWTSVKSPRRENVFFPVEEKSKDSDSDGLSDFLEEMLGTDIHNKDSDGDKIPDKFEVESGLDPLLKSEEKKEIFKKHLLKKSQAKIRIPKTPEDVLKMSGNTEPFAKIKILVHSDPHYFLTQADKNGKWEYEVSKLEKGEHTYQYQVFDDSGIASEYSEPVSFKLEEDIAVTKNCHSREGGNPLGHMTISSNCPLNEDQQKINDDISDIIQYQESLQSSSPSYAEAIEDEDIKTQIKKNHATELYNEETPWHLNPDNFQSFTHAVIPEAQAKGLLRSDYNSPPNPTANAWTYLSLALFLLNFASIGVFWVKLNERMALISLRENI